MTFLFIMTGLLLVGFIIFLLDQKKRGMAFDGKTMVFTVVSASLLVFGYVNITKIDDLKAQNQDLRFHIQNVDFQISSLRGDLHRLQSALEDIQAEDAMIRSYEAIPIAFDGETDAIRYEILFSLKERPSDSQVSLIQTDQYGAHTVHALSSLSLNYRQDITLETDRIYDLSVLISGDTVAEYALDTIDLKHILDNRMILEPYDLFEEDETETTVLIGVANMHFGLDELKIDSVVFDFFTDNGETMLASRTVTNALGESEDRESFVIEYTTLSKNLRDLLVTATVTDELGNVYTLTGGL